MSVGAGSRALRRGRVSLSGCVYLVTTLSASRAPLFADFHDARCVVRALHSVAPQAQTMAYVLMPDHLHWLLRLGEGTNLSALVGLVKRRASKWINRDSPSPKRVWAAGFHDHALRKEEDLRQLAQLVMSRIRAHQSRRCRSHRRLSWQGLMSRLGLRAAWEGQRPDLGCRRLVAGVAALPLPQKPACCAQTCRTVKQSSTGLPA